MNYKCSKCNIKGVKSFMSITAKGKKVDGTVVVRFSCNTCTYSYLAYNPKGVKL